MPHNIPAWAKSKLNTRFLLGSGVRRTRYSAWFSAAGLGLAVAALTACESGGFGASFRSQSQQGTQAFSISDEERSSERGTAKGQASPDPHSADASQRANGRHAPTPSYGQRDSALVSVSRNDLVGEPQARLLDLMGPPDLIRLDGTMRVLQFRLRDCIVDAFFTEPAQYAVYVEFRGKRPKAPPVGEVCALIR